MTDPLPSLRSRALIDDPRPWAFTRAELTASLRRFTGDPTLIITNITDHDIPFRRPAIGRIRGLRVAAQGTKDYTFELVLKEPQSSTRSGMAGVGLREVSLYQGLGDYLPVRIPQLLAADPGGDWLVLARLPEGRAPEQWQAADYLLATDQLVALHDRFWGLGEDLAMYNWLGRPLGSEFSLLLQAAAAGVNKLAHQSTPNRLGKDPELNKLLERLLGHAEKIRSDLQSSPSTLMHGDYWPGNIHVHTNGSLTVYDWDAVAVGPAISDLVHFIQSSLWWFAPLPLAPEEIVAHYRSRLQQANAFAWGEADWQAQWDYALLWEFMHKWVELLSSIPDTVLAARMPQLEMYWLTPVKQAAARRLQG